MNYKDKFVGIRLYGYCGGYFERDTYCNKIIIASGENWVVAKNDWNEIEFASFDSKLEMDKCIEEWSKEESE